MNNKEIAKTNTISAKSTMQERLVSTICLKAKGITILLGVIKLVSILSNSW